jgi:putative redox protein
MNDEWKEITADWCGESTFVGKNQSGGTVQMGSLEGKAGVSPMEMLLVALAGCTGMDIVSILTKKRQQPQDFQLKVRGKRAADFPKIWSEIEVTYHLWGDNITPKDVEQAIELSEEKYCSVGIMLGAAAKISSNYVLHQEAEFK